MSARDVLASVLTFPGGGLLADAQMAALGAAGYVVVPKEPTFEQQDRALHDMGCANPKMSRQQLRDFYRAMLAAAQEPTS